MILPLLSNTLNAESTVLNRAASLEHLVFEFEYTKSEGTDQLVHRGYSNFLLNMAFISPSEVENIHIFHFTSEIKDIFNKNI